MKPAVTYSLLAVGALVLFSAATIGFAKMKGAPLHELPLFGALFPAPAETDATDEHAGPGDTHEPAAGAVAEHGEAAPTHAAETHSNATANEHRPKVARASLLDAFSLETPLDGAELQGLVKSLRDAQREADQRLGAVAKREVELDERERALKERQQELLEMKSRMEAASAEVQPGAVSAAPVKATKQELDEREWAAKAQLFESGEAAAIAERLTSFNADDAAKILVALPPKRARDLLAALPTEKWKEFADAYSKRAAAQTPPPSNH